jgi:glycosyltransferase involved in cell wall biosynthesis
MDITIVLPVHNERENLRALVEEIECALTPTNRSFEIIAVDDGSDDGSSALIHDLANEKPFVRGIFFRKNYGQSAAFDAGFRAASGRLIVTMDADLQNDPADIPRMVAMIDEQGLDFVAGNRGKRQDGLVFRRMPSRIANWMIRRVTGTRLRDLGCSLKVYRREVVEELRLYGEMHRFIGVLVEGLGARIAETPVNHRPRRAGQSKYGLSRTFKVMLDLITVWFMRGYETKPIYIFGGIGMLLGMISGLLLAIVAWQRVINHIYVHLQPLFTIAMIFSVMAVQFLGMGLLAEIMVRTYFESRQKSSYLVSERIGFATDKPEVALSISPWVKEAGARVGMAK